MSLEKSYFDSINQPVRARKYSLDQILEQTIFREIIAAILLRQSGSDHEVPIPFHDITLLRSYGIWQDGRFTPFGDQILERVELDQDALENGDLDLIVKN